MAVYSYIGTVKAFAWSPSTYRMLSVPSVDAALTPSSYSFNWPLNYLNSQLDFSININQLLRGTSDSIASVSASVFPAGLDIIYTYGVGSISTLWIASGSQGVTYNISVNITTQHGRIIPISINLTVPGVGVTAGLLQYSIVQVPKTYVDTAVAASTAIAQQALLIATQALSANNPASLITLTNTNGLALTDYTGNPLVIA